METEGLGEIISKDAFNAEEQLNYQHFIEVLSQIIIEMHEKQPHPGSGE